jgi:hypothetical protein
MMEESLHRKYRLSSLDHRHDELRESLCDGLPHPGTTAGSTVCRRVHDSPRFDQAMRSSPCSGWPLLISSICVIAVVLIADMANPASAQTTPDPKARCAQLLAYYDRYGSSRGEDSSGSRHMTRIGAGIDCDHGRYEEGIRAMEDLLKQKKFTVPAPCSGDRRQAIGSAALPGSNGGCD